MKRLSIKPDVCILLAKLCKVVVEKSPQSKLDTEKNESVDQRSGWNRRRTRNDCSSEKEKER